MNDEEQAEQKDSAAALQRRVVIECAFHQHAKYWQNVLFGAHQCRRMKGMKGKEREQVTFRGMLRARFLQGSSHQNKLHIDVHRSVEVAREYDGAVCGKREDEVHDKEKQRHLRKGRDSHVCDDEC